MTDRQIIALANRLEKVFSDEIADCDNHRLIQAYDAVLCNLLSKIKSDWEFDEDSDSYYLVREGRPQTESPTLGEALAFVYANVGKTFDRGITNADIKKWVAENL